MTKKTRVQRPIIKAIILNWRVTAEEKEMINKAAKIKDKSVALFVMDYLMPHVKRILAKENINEQI